MNLEKFHYLFNIKRVKIFLAISDGISMSRVNKEVDVTYNHMTSVFDMFKDGGLIKIEKTGRENKIFLTEKGRKLRLLFKKLDESF